MKKSYLFAAVVISGAFGIMALLGPGIGVTLVILTGLGVGLVGVGYLQTYYTVWQSDPADLRAVSDTDEAVEIAGTVGRHEKTLNAPFTGTECVLYEIKLIELGMSQAKKRRRRERLRESDADARINTENVDDRTLATDEESQPFVVATDTGEALIQPDGSQWQITTEHDINVQSGEEPPERITDWLDTQPHIDRVAGDERIFREIRLDMNEEIHIYGPVRQAGSSFDLPGGVKVVIGLDNPGSDNFVVGEDSLSDLIGQIRSENRTRFVISAGGEVEAERRLLKTGLFWGGAGVAFLALGVFLIV